MKKTNTSPISGTQELLPEKQILFNNLKAGIANIYQNRGFLNIETPVIDRDEILFAKAGGDTEKQVYRLFKTAETASDSNQALRFDHTVPLARYVVEHENDLVFPFKVSQIGRNFRGERAQKGRFREFYQCDIDVIGRNSLPLAYDADIISTLLATFSVFSLKTPLTARISNRKILTGIIETFNLENLAKDIYSIIDHSEKIPLEKTQNNFREIGLSPENVDFFMEFINISGPSSEVIQKLQNFNFSNPTFNLGLQELTEVLRLVKLENPDANVIADLKIVRGLDYYTGTVFEFNLPEYPEIGSVCGGGRYDNLASSFSDQLLPGVGGSIGLTRLFYILNEKNLLINTFSRPIDYAIIPVSPNEFAYSFQVAQELRASGKSVTIIFTEKRLSDKLSYAAKIAQAGIILGESEAKSQQYQIKQFN